MAEKYAVLGAHLSELSEFADEHGLPKQWIVCPSCQRQAWVVPPHGFEPCPLVLEMAQQLGLKLDAERMAAIRTGIGVEEIARAARELGEEASEDPS